MTMRTPLGPHEPLGADDGHADVPTARRPDDGPTGPGAARDGVPPPSPYAAVIEQAKGLIMGAYAVGPDAAFEMIRKWSRDRNLKVRDVCSTLVATASADGAPAGPAGRPRVTLDEALAALSRERNAG